MSIFYSAVYLITNVFVPVSLMIYKQSKLLRSTESEEQQHKIITENQQKKQKELKNVDQQHNWAHSQLKENNTNLSQPQKASYGKWFLLVITMLFFNFLTEIIRRNYTLALLGMIIKISVIYLPPNITQTIQQIIQKLHLQIYLQILRIRAIDLYLEYTWRINSYLILQQIKDKDQKLQILIHFKDEVSRMELELEQNQELKNKSYIVAEKKLLTIKKSNLKCYENVGVNCDILKSDQVNLLKMLSEKKISNKRGMMSARDIPQVKEQPTNDNILINNVAKPQSRSGNHSVPKPPSKNLVSVQKMKQSQNPSHKKRSNELKQQQILIKRSKSDIVDQLDSEQQSPSKLNSSRLNQLKQNMTERNQIPVSENQKVNYSQMKRKISPTKKNHNKFSSEIGDQTGGINMLSKIQNQNNLGTLDIKESENQNSRNSRSINRTSTIREEIQNNGNRNRSTFGIDSGSKFDFKQEGSYNLKQQVTSPHIIPAGINISKIQPYQFQLNLSSLSNPLIPSGNLSKSKILPTSLFMSSSNKQIPSSSILNKGQTLSSILSQPVNPNLMNKLSNVSHVNTQRIGQENFNQESSINQKVQMAINQSEYSDLFDSQGEEQKEEPNLEIKVQAVVENPSLSGNIPGTNRPLRPRIDICNIQLYDNGQVRFYSLYDKLTFHGKLKSMKKIPDNFYELIVDDLGVTTKSQQKKQQSKQQTKKQLIKKVKFRGQAKPFMKYLQK